MIGALRDTKKKKKFIILLAVLLFALIFVFGGTGAVAEEGSNDNLTDSIEDILGELDTEELQKYLDSLTEEQKQWFGEGDIGDKILSVINGDFSMDYGSFLSSMAALVFDGLDGLLSTFCVICA